MLSSHIFREFWIAVLKHLGNPAISDMTITYNVEVVDHPVDGFARAGLAEVIALRSVVQLLIGENIVEGLPVPSALLNHTEFRGLRDTELLPEVLEGIRKCFFECHLSHIIWGRTQKPQPPYISDLLIGGLQYRGGFNMGQRHHLMPVKIDPASAGGSLEDWRSVVSTQTPVPLTAPPALA